MGGESKLGQIDRGEVQAFGAVDRTEFDGGEEDLRIRY
jgi:hypothetical protein